MTIYLYLITISIFFGQDSLRTSKVIGTAENQFIDVTVHSISSPLRWNNNDLNKLAVTIGGAAILYHYDDEISSFFKRNHTDFLDDIESVGDVYGKPSTALYLTSSMYLSGRLFKNKWIKETTVLLGSTLATTGFFQFLLTRTTGRLRPEYNQGKNDFDFFSFKKKRHAMPSGHTTIALSTSLVFANQVKSKWLKAGFYTLGGITALSRIYEQAHFASDVFISTALTYAVFTANVNYFKNKLVGSMAIVPTLNGFVVSIDF